MENIGLLIARFPERELEIRRCYDRGVHFRAICADYEDASTALAYWKKFAKEDDRKLAEYASLLSELEVEILAQLDRHPTLVP